MLMFSTVLVDPFCARCSGISFFFRTIQTDLWAMATFSAITLFFFSFLFLRFTVVCRQILEQALGDECETGLKKKRLSGTYIDILQSLYIKSITDYKGLNTCLITYSTNLHLNVRTEKFSL